MCAERFGLGIEDLTNSERVTQCFRVCAIDENGES